MAGCWRTASALPPPPRPATLAPAAPTSRASPGVFAPGSRRAQHGDGAERFTLASAQLTLP
jgi:hypothetical protein